MEAYQPSDPNQTQSLKKRRQLPDVGVALLGQRLFIVAQDVDFADFAAVMQLTNSANLLPGVHPINPQNYV